MNTREESGEKLKELFWEYKSDTIVDVIKTELGYTNEMKGNVEKIIRIAGKHNLISGDGMDYIDELDYLIEEQQILGFILGMRVYEDCKKVSEIIKFVSENINIR